MGVFKKEISEKQFYINILKCALIGIAITFAVLLLFAVLMLVCNIKTNMASPLASIALAVGGFSGGYFSAIKNKSKGIICGAVNAAVLFFVITAVGLTVNKDITLISFIHLAVAFLSSLIGGILGVNKADKIKLV